MEVAGAWKETQGGPNFRITQLCKGMWAVGMLGPFSKKRPFMKESFLTAHERIQG